MTFRLLIECTKNIDKLNIDFSDGTTTVMHSNETIKTPIEPIEPIESSKPPNTTQHFGMKHVNESETSVNTRKVKLPQIDKIQNERKINVASELQNLDI